MAGVFICYRRRQNPGDARSLYLGLRDRFRVVMDIDHLIQPGEDFLVKLHEALAASTVVLVVVGKRWLADLDRRAKRRSGDDDYVRIEIATALQRGIRIIPVLIDDAQMPAGARLPEDIRPFSRREAVRLHHESWESDLVRLIDALDLFHQDAASEASQVAADPDDDTVDDALEDPSVPLRERLDGPPADWPRAADVERARADLARFAGSDNSRATMLRARLDAFVVDLASRYETALASEVAAIEALISCPPDDEQTLVRLREWQKTLADLAPDRAVGVAAAINRAGRRIEVLRLIADGESDSASVGAEIDRLVAEQAGWRSVDLAYDQRTRSSQRRAQALDAPADLRARLDAHHRDAEARYELMRRSHAEVISLEDADRFLEAEAILVELQADRGPDWQVTYRTSEVRGETSTTTMPVSEALERLRARSIARTGQVVERILREAQDALAAEGPRAAEARLAGIHASARQLDLNRLDAGLSADLQQLDTRLTGELERLAHFEQAIGRAAQLKPSITAWRILCDVGAANPDLHRYSPDWLSQVAVTRATVVSDTWAALRRAWGHLMDGEEPAAIADAQAVSDALADFAETFAQEYRAAKDLESLAAWTARQFEDVNRALAARPPDRRSARRILTLIEQGLSDRLQRLPEQLAGLQSTECASVRRLRERLESMPRASEPPPDPQPDRPTDVGDGGAREDDPVLKTEPLDVSDPIPHEATAPGKPARRDDREPGDGGDRQSSLVVPIVVGLILLIIIIAAVWPAGSR